jgi:hypothetical protein
MIFPVIIKYVKDGMVETVEVLDKEQLSALLAGITSETSQCTEYTVYECTRIVTRKVEWVGVNP